MKTVLIALAAGVACTTPALAHLDPGVHGSLAAGLSHPLVGLDHVLAMMAVGLWACLLGGRAVWHVPLAFVGLMMAGFGAATLGVELPAVEPVVAASVVALGLLVLAAVKAPTPAAVVIVGVFALFHGHAHGGELGEAGALPFLAGFVLATALLHGMGVIIGRAGTRIGGVWVARLAGGATALAGLSILAGA